MMLAIVLGFTVIALGALSFVDHCMAAKTEELRSQAAQIEYENQVLSHNIADLGSAKSVERIALGNGFDSFIMFNVYAQRATRPDDMEKTPNAGVGRRQAPPQRTALRCRRCPAWVYA